MMLRNIFCVSTWQNSFHFPTKSSADNSLPQEFSFFYSIKFLQKRIAYNATYKTTWLHYRSNPDKLCQHYQNLTWIKVTRVEPGLNVVV